MNGTVFGTLNTSIIIIYLLSMLFIGWLFSRNNQDEEQFFLGSRKVPWLAVAMSMYASLTSAITYIGLPAIAYQENIALIGVSIASIAVTPFILRFFYLFIISNKLRHLINLSKKIWTNGTKKCGSTFCTYPVRMAWYCCLCAFTCTINRNWIFFDYMYPFDGISSHNLHNIWRLNRGYLDRCYSVYYSNWWCNMDFNNINSSS